MLDLSVSKYRALCRCCQSRTRVYRSTGCGLTAPAAGTGCLVGQQLKPGSVCWVPGSHVIAGPGHSWAHPGQSPWVCLQLAGSPGSCSTCSIKKINTSKSSGCCPRLLCPLLPPPLLPGAWDFIATCCWVWTQVHTEPPDPRTSRAVNQSSPSSPIHAPNNLQFLVLQGNSYEKKKVTSQCLSHTKEESSCRQCH